jgi:hypothetical protein
MTMFGIGHLIRNKKTNEDGRITAVKERDEGTIYSVSVPLEPTNWKRGGVAASWSESDVEGSQNESLLNE